jgi:4'-phosphopantetheinyl transferase
LRRASEVHVWLAPEALVDEPGVSAALRSLLPDDEISRLADFRAETARRLHLLARGLQRLMLSRLNPGVAPRDWRFDRPASGRPSLSAAQGGLDLDFNLAHTRGLVVMAVARGGQVGIDVESIERRRSLEIARRYFSAREIEAFEALPADAQPRRFIELWTLKEAYLKAIGTGISGGLGSMTFDWRGGGIHFERASDPEAARWQFRQWSWGGAHLLALAYLVPAEMRLETRELTAADLVGASGQEQRSET